MPPRIALWTLTLLLAHGTAAAQAEAPEEVVVRGRQIGELRAAVERAREAAYALFNELNSSNDFDILCREETRYFSHAKTRVCRARFEDRISSQAAKEYMSTLFARCPPDSDGAIQWQTCMFNGVGQAAKSNAQAVEGQAPAMHDRLNDEIVRVANENDEFARAILDVYEADRRYDEARKRRDD